MHKACPVCNGRGTVPVYEPGDRIHRGFQSVVTCSDCCGTGWERPLPARLAGPPKPRARAEIWDGAGWIVLVDGRPIGCTIREDEAKSIARWLNNSLTELLANVQVAETRLAVSQET